jgi:two-component system chemotaxis response regulator CheY
MPKILVVDDSESQRVRLRQDLEGAGYQVVEGQNGNDGLEKLESNPDVALVICDVNMPEMDGLTFCSKIHEGGKHVGLPIFMLTTEASPELRQKAKQFGVRAWIIKPHVAAKLLEAAAKVIKK